MTAPAATDEHAQALSSVLLEMAGDASRERVSVADLLAAMSDRAIAALLLLFALPNVIPMPPGTSAVLGAPLLFLAAQLMFGRKPWLPAFIARRSMPHSQFAMLASRAAPWLARAERLMKPRLSVLAQPPAEYAIGALCLVLAIIVFLPIPFGNMLPALSICLLALGILERDGLWVMAGLACSVVSVALVWGLIYAVVKSAVYMVLRVLG